MIIRNSSDFNKLVKLKAADLHTEIIIREDVKKKEEKKTAAVYSCLKELPPRSQFLLGST